MWNIQTMHSICFCRVPFTNFISIHFYLVFGVLDSVSRLQRTENHNLSYPFDEILPSYCNGPESACDVFFRLSRWQSCVEFSRPYRVLRTKTLTKSQSVLSRWKQASRYIFATQTDVKPMLRICYVRIATRKCIVSFDLTSVWLAKIYLLACFQPFKIFHTFYIFYILHISPPNFEGEGNGLEYPSE